MNMQELARFLMIAGGCIAAAGVLLWIGTRLGLGRLPGDIVVRKGGVTVAFPIVTCLVVSVLLTLLLNLPGRK